MCKLCGSLNTKPLGNGIEWICLDCGHKGKPRAARPADRKF